jgi:hypothetical protein
MECFFSLGNTQVSNFMSATGFQTCIQQRDQLLNLEEMQTLKTHTGDGMPSALGSLPNMLLAATFLLPDE